MHYLIAGTGDWLPKRLGAEVIVLPVRKAEKLQLPQSSSSVKQPYHAKARKFGHPCKYLFSNNYSPTKGKRMGVRALK